MPNPRDPVDLSLRLVDVRDMDLVVRYADAEGHAVFPVKRLTIDEEDEISDTHTAVTFERVRPVDHGPRRTVRIATREVINRYSGRVISRFTYSSPIGVDVGGGKICQFSPVMIRVLTG